LGGRRGVGNGRRKLIMEWSERVCGMMMMRTISEVDCAAASCLDVRDDCVIMRCNMFADL
jgi:hypothetical protein